MCVYAGKLCDGTGSISVRSDSENKIISSSEIMKGVIITPLVCLALSCALALSCNGTRLAFCSSRLARAYYPPGNYSVALFADYCFFFPFSWVCCSWFFFFFFLFSGVVVDFRIVSLFFFSSSFGNYCFSVYYIYFYISFLQSLVFLFLYYQCILIYIFYLFLIRPFHCLSRLLVDFFFLSLPITNLLIAILKHFSLSINIMAFLLRSGIHQVYFSSFSHIRILGKRKTKHK